MLTGTACEPPPGRWLAGTTGPAPRCAGSAGLQAGSARRLLTKGCVWQLARRAPLLHSWQARHSTAGRQGHRSRTTAAARGTCLSIQQLLRRAIALQQRLQPVALHTHTDGVAGARATMSGWPQASAGSTAAQSFASSRHAWAAVTCLEGGRVEGVVRDGAATAGPHAQHQLASLQGRKEEGKREWR